MDSSDSLNEIDIADKKRQRLAIERMMAEFLARGGEIEQLSRLSFEEMKERRLSLWRSGLKKKPPSKPWETQSE